MLNKKQLSFKLVMPDVQPFLDGPEPDEVRIPLLGHKVTVKKKDELYRGTCIGVHPDPLRGDVHSPIDGVVTSVTAGAVTIQRQEVTNPVSEAVQPVFLDGLEGDALAAALKSLGLGMREFRKRGDHIVINGFNPEPGIRWAGGMYTHHLEDLKAGIDIVRRLMQPSQISIVLPRGSRFNLGDDVRHFYSKPEYPNSVGPLIIKAATGKENPPNVSPFNLHSLWRYGQVAKTGLPALRTVITVQGKNFRVLAGTPLRMLLACMEVYPEEGDYVVLGGYMRGQAVADIDRAVSSYHYGLFYVPKDDFAPVHENPCISCGACVLYCPSHLMPNKISRNAEFQNYEECRKLHVEACMDCGMCSFTCIARRPMLQYMREAKKAIAAAKAEQLPMD